MIVLLVLTFLIVALITSIIYFYKSKRSTKDKLLRIFICAFVIPFMLYAISYILLSAFFHETSGIVGSILFLIIAFIISIVYFHKSKRSTKDKILRIIICAFVTLAILAAITITFLLSAIGNM